MNESEIHDVLSQALDADESKNESLAIALYMKTVEMILQIQDKETRTRLNKFATQALDRAEELKGIKRQTVPGPSIPVQPTISVKSKCSALTKLFYEHFINCLKFNDSLKTHQTINHHWDYLEVMFTRKKRKKYWNIHHTSIQMFSFHL